MGLRHPKWVTSVYKLGSSDSANIPGVPVSTRCDAGTGAESGRDAGRRKWTRLFPEDEEMHFYLLKMLSHLFLAQNIKKPHELTRW